MDLANLAINATPSIPFAEDEYLFTADNNPLNFPSVPTHQQPVLQANVRQQLPAYGYNFLPATPQGSIAQPHYPPPTSHVNYGNYIPHHDPSYAQFQHLHHGPVEPPTRTVVTPPPPPQQNTNKRDLSLSPQKPKKRTRGGGLGSRGGRGNRGKGSARGGAPRGSAKSGDSVSETVDQSTLDDNSDKSVVKLEIIEDDEVFANTRWTDDERGILFEYYLGTESDGVFEKLKSNATYAHKKVGHVLYLFLQSELF